MDWPISWQKVKDSGGSGSGLPVLDLTDTPFPSFENETVGESINIEIPDSKIGIIEQLISSHQTPIIAKFSMDLGEGARITWETILCQLRLEGSINMLVGISFPVIGMAYTSIYFEGGTWTAKTELLTMV